MFLQPFTVLPRGAGSVGAVILDLQLRHLLGACRRRFYVDGGRFRTFSSGTSWIPDGDRWWPLPEIPAAPPTRPAIDVSNFSGGRCRRYRQHPPLGPPSTSSTSMVAAARPAASTPRGSAINVCNIDGGRCRNSQQHPTGARHQRLQLWWWPLPEISTAPPGGPPSTSSTSVVVTVGPPDSTPPAGSPSTSPTSMVAVAEPPDNTPRGLAINVFNFGGGRCQKSQQHPLGAYH
jgi:hypothetical protein